MLGLTQEGEFQCNRNRLWTAPEVLRMTTRPINGTQKADVYSFAIILQEIMFRAEPYFVDIDPPQRMDYIDIVIYDHKRSRNNQVVMYYFLENASPEVSSR